MARTRPSVPPADLAEAARMLRAVLESVPPSTPKERATAWRVEGAAVTLGALAAHQT